MGNKGWFKREIFAWYLGIVLRIVDNEIMISKTLADFQIKVAMRCIDDKKF